MENSSVRALVRALNDNDTAKIALGRELLDQGLDTDAVCRILGLSPDMFSQSDHR